MRLSPALTLSHDIAATSHAHDGLGELLDPELAKSAFETAGVSHRAQAAPASGDDDLVRDRFGPVSPDFSPGSRQPNGPCFPLVAASAVVIGVSA